MGEDLAQVGLDGTSVRQLAVYGQYIIRHIHDIPKTYLDVTRERFMDDVCNHAVDRFLIIRPETPLRVLTPVFISRMTDEQLEHIAGEEPKLQKQRKKLKSDVKSLSEAKRVL